MPQDTGTQARETQEAAWWDAWWRRDLSWDGLARIEVPGGSLQDYWRTEAGRLIDEPGTGRRWTRFHCPFVFADGTPSPKAHWSPAEWAELHSALRTRLAMGGHARPAMLTGVVLDGLWEPEAEVPDADGFLYVRADLAYFRDGVDLSNNGMGLADFSDVWFGGKAVFQGARAVASEFRGALYAERMVRERFEVVAGPVEAVPVRAKAGFITPRIETAEILEESTAKKGIPVWRIAAGVVACVAIVATAIALMPHP